MERAKRALDLAGGGTPHAVRRLTREQTAILGGKADPVLRDQIGQVEIADADLQDQIRRAAKRNARVRRIQRIVEVVLGRAEGDRLRQQILEHRARRG